MERELEDDVVMDGSGDAAMEGDSRAVKPLRKPRRVFTETLSLPAGFMFSEHSNTGSSTQTNLSEDDWSLELPNLNGT
jgi:hypothetical protein